MILHFCPRADWEAGRRAGSYVADSLRDEGFIHCSTAAQVRRSADKYAAGRTDLVLLEIDEDRLPVPVRWEAGRDADELFPHVYGPIPVDAVTAVRDFPPDPDGAWPA